MIEQLSITEGIAATTGLLGVWLTAKQNILCWPVALISIVTSLIVFYATKLYPDAILQIFYLVLTIYGWYTWKSGSKDGIKKKIGRIKLPYMFAYMGISIALVQASTYYFYHHTDAALPFWDSISLVWGIIGTLWMAKKWIEHWIVWIIVDLMCVGIYIYKDLYFFAGQFIIFTGLAIYGFMEWRKELRTI